MKAMLQAIKQRKSGASDHEGMGHAAQHADEGKKDLHGFVATLSDSDKSQLKNILDKSNTDGMAISKGAPSMDEQSKIEQAMAEENKTNAMASAEQDSDPAVESDEIAKSMLDSRHLGENPPTHKPRNLSERMKMSLASKLKGKGKI